MLQKLILLCCGGLCILQSITFAQQQRISGGVAASRGEAPYMMAIRINGQFRCAGVLVKPRFVVTAARCVDGYRPVDLIVTGGVLQLNQRGMRRAVQSITYPSAFDYGTKNFDICVLHLRAPMQGANIATIPLCNNPGWQAGDLIDIAGWGATNANNDNISNSLRITTVPLISKADCIQRYENQNEQLTRTMFCAQGSGTEAPCNGDAGGAAVFNNQLCGTFSWGRGCGQTDFPAVYTNVFVVRTFIQKAINAQL